MTDFIYTDVFYPRNSSVIETVFYNASNEQMVVRLLNGVLAGYDNVDVGLYANFKTQNTFRGGSVGGFWNTMIKPYMSGFDTSEIENFLTVEESEAIDNTLGLEVNDKGVDVTEKFTTVDVGEPVVDPGYNAVPKSRYEVIYTETVTVSKTKVIYANNENEALEAFRDSQDEDITIRITELNRRF